jgi:hypothetical protein
VFAYELYNYCVYIISGDEYSTIYALYCFVYHLVSTWDGGPSVLGNDLHAKDKGSKKRSFDNDDDDDDDDELDRGRVGVEILARFESFAGSWIRIVH